MQERAFKHACTLAINLAKITLLQLLQLQINLEKQKHSFFAFVPFMSTSDKFIFRSSAPWEFVENLYKQKWAVYIVHLIYDCGADTDLCALPKEVHNNEIQCNKKTH